MNSIYQMEEVLLLNNCSKRALCPRQNFAITHLIVVRFWRQSGCQKK